MVDKIRKAYEVLNNLEVLISDIAKGKDKSAKLKVYYSSQEEFDKMSKSGKHYLSETNKWNKINKFELYVNAYYSDILESLDTIILDKVFTGLFKRHITAIFYKRLDDIKDEEYEKYSDIYVDINSFDYFLGQTDFDNPYSLRARLDYVKILFDL